MQIGELVATQSVAIKSQQLFTNSGVKQAVLFPFGKCHPQREDSAVR